MSGVAASSSSLLGQGTNSGALVLGVPDVSCSSGLFGLVVSRGAGAASCIVGLKVRAHGAWMITVGTVTAADDS